MILFHEKISPQTSDKILDLGGYPRTWTMMPQIPKRIDCLNIHKTEWDPESAPDHRIATAQGDACALEYPDNSYDIVFSNAVIPHVGGWEKQRAFASEARRVGKKLWIHAPAYECPLEPNFMAPAVHWLPISIRRRVLRWFTPWGWLVKPSQEKVDKTIRFTRLLTRKEMMELFPDCELITERLLWVFVKSYVAYRPDDSDVPSEATGP